MPENLLFVVVVVVVVVFYLLIFKLEYSCFTLLCQFLLYSKVNRLYM